MEEWRPVVGWEGLYEVSNEGRVRSLPRVVRAGRGVGSMRTVGGVVLSPSPSKRGYVKIDLRDRQRSSSVHVHRIVAIAFLGESSSGMQVNHINGIKHDNRIVNLEWVTPAENTRHSVEVLGNSVTESENGNARLSQSQVSDIVKRRNRGESCTSLSKEFGVSVTHISRICTGASWRATLRGVVDDYVFDKDRANRVGEFNGRARLTAEIVREARLLHIGGMTSNDIARRFGVSFSTMHFAVTGRSWKHVT